MKNIIFIEIINLVDRPFFWPSTPAADQSDTFSKQFLMLLYELRKVKINKLLNPFLFGSAQHPFLLRNKTYLWVSWTQ